MTIAHQELLHSTRAPRLWRLFCNRATLSGAEYILRLALAAIFIFSSVPKLRHPYDFLAIIYNYQILGPTSGAVFAAVLPWLEIMTAVALIFRIYRFSAAILASILGSMFTIAQITVVHRGITTDCGCFGSLPGTDAVDYSTVVRAASVAFFAILLLVLCLATRDLPTPSSARLSSH